MVSMLSAWRSVSAASASQASAIGRLAGRLGRLGRGLGRGLVGRQIRPALLQGGAEILDLLAQILGQQLVAQDGISVAEERLCPRLDRGRFGELTLFEHEKTPDRVWPRCGGGTGTLFD
jgi:hypothetical protein